MCREDGGVLVLKNALYRVVLVQDADLPGFVRVIVNDHVREMTDLPAGPRMLLLDAVFAVEGVLREVLAPAKVNLASLGNAVPHLHWHVIPRFDDDPFFPHSVWGARQRATPEPMLAARRAVLPVLRQRLVEAFGVAATGMPKPQ